MRIGARKQTFEASGKLRLVRTMRLEFQAMNIGTTRRYALRFLLIFSAIVTLLSAYTACSTLSTPVTSPEAAITAARLSWKSIDEKHNFRLTVYNEKEIAKFEPYTATLVQGEWIVKGTIPANFRGETLETTVRERDGVVSVQVLAID
jgi:hypothetical protein